MNDSCDLEKLLNQLSKSGGVPITLSKIPPTAIDTARILSEKVTLNVPFPKCATELLSLINTKANLDEKIDDVTRYFNEYFKFGAHIVNWDTNVLDENLISGNNWPSECCICNPHVNLDGNRNPPPFPLNTTPSLKRLFLGDIIWLFYFERMGIFQILGTILDSFACSGKLPISIVGNLKNSILTTILEIMTRQTKTGLSSTIRDRNCVYRTSLGWITESGRKLNLETEVNTGFNFLFHKFIYNALEYYKDKRLAVAIRGTTTPTATASVATLVSISETLVLLQKRFDAFLYGRNYYNTLAGIIWTISGMSVVRELRTTLGIPPAYNNPEDYISAAYEILVMKRSVTHGESNRYLLHKECAQNGRDILLDLEVINVDDKSESGELDRWLNQVEGKIEAYRTAYRTLTGIDLGATGTPAVEQQV